MPQLASKSSESFDLLVANVVALRAKEGWSTRALAEQAHVSRSSVVGLESGHTKLSLSIVDNVARVLDVKTGSLFGKRPIARDEGDGLIEVVLAENLVAARRRLMLTQDKLSQRSGINRAMIANIERQARNPSLPTLAKLATALDLSIEALLTESGAGPDQ